jgi:hypothetical protein
MRQFICFSAILVIVIGIACNMRPKQPVYRVYYEFNLVKKMIWHHKGNSSFIYDTIPVDTIYKQINYELDSCFPVRDCNHNLIEARYNVYYSDTDTIYKERR